jgi:hypothetical protein
VLLAFRLITPIISAPLPPVVQRFVGQCNLQTDIKECCFLGCSDELVATGSDDGRVFIFRTATGECIRVFTADEDVANAVQPHPHLPVLATSGIESTVKLWSPEGEPTTGGSIGEVVRRNQERLKEGPTVLRGIDPRIIAALTDNPELLRALVQVGMLRCAALWCGRSVAVQCCPGHACRNACFGAGRAFLLGWAVLAAYHAQSGCLQCTKLRCSWACCPHT